MNQSVPQYKPPPGYYDQPFSWIFDGTSISSAGGISKNNYVRIDSGYGDFLLRRVAGLANFVPWPTGQFQIMDESKAYISSEPVNTSQSSDQLSITREMLYHETSLIRFDLYGISGSSLLIPRRQICFQGVRRVHGQQPNIVQKYVYKPKPYTYTISQAFTTMNTISVVQPITDFDFDLYDIRITYNNLGLPATVTRIWIQDAAKGYISNIPMLEYFLNAAPGSSYKQGAFVPPLPYPNRGNIRIDMVPNHVSLLPFTAQIHLIGENRFPC